MAKNLPAKRARRSAKNNNVLEFKKSLEKQEATVSKTNESKLATSFVLPKASKPITITPRNDNQKRYLAALEDESQTIIIASGSAGAGKTMIAVYYALQQLQKGNIDRIIVTRPLVASGENDVGTLSGNLIEKLYPWNRAVIDYLNEFYPLPIVKKMLEEEVVQLLPCQLARGSTWKRAIILIDEASNLLNSQMKLLLTRIGEGARVIVCGDVTQHDRPHQTNGLADLINRVRENPSDDVSLIEFGKTDIQRHPIIRTVLSLYGDEV